MWWEKELQLGDSICHRHRRGMWQVGQVVIFPALGWAPGEVTPILVPVRINRVELWTVTRASVTKKGCCSLLLKVPELIRSVGC